MKKEHKDVSVAIKGVAQAVATELERLRKAQVNRYSPSSEKIATCVLCSGDIVVDTMWKNSSRMIGGPPSMVPTKECYCATCGLTYNEEVVRRNNA